jgi:hypothetical protein
VSTAPRGTNPGHPGNVRPAPLEYRATAAADNTIPINYLRTAVYCGAIPLVIGLLVFAAWLVTGWERLMPIGVLVMAGGTLLVVVGIVALAVHAYRELRTRGAAIGSARRMLLTLLLLLVNFPVAFSVMRAVWEISTAYLVTLVNASGAPVDSFVLSGPGFVKELGPLPAGGRANYVCRFSGDGELTFASQQGGTIATGVVDGYVTKSVGADEIVSIGLGGQLTVTRQRRVPLQKWWELR